MSIALGDYTTTASVRGCLGVDANDCPDGLMIESHLDDELTIDLNEWLPTHSTIYQTGIASAATAAEKTLAVLLSLYAQWYCAHQMALRPLTVPQITTDGKAQIDRFKVDLERVAKLAASKKQYYRSKLDFEVNAVALPTGVFEYVSLGLPAQDPITEGIQ